MTFTAAYLSRNIAMLPSSIAFAFDSFARFGSRGLFCLRGSEGRGGFGLDRERDLTRFGIKFLHEKWK